MKQFLSSIPVENPYISRQIQEVIFSRKRNIYNHPVVFFNSLLIHKKSTQEHLGLLLDEKLKFLETISEKIKKLTTSNNLILTLPRPSH